MNYPHFLRHGGWHFSILTDTHQRICAPVSVAALTLNGDLPARPFRATQPKRTALMPPRNTPLTQVASNYIRTQGSSLTSWIETPVNVHGFRYFYPVAREGGAYDMIGRASGGSPADTLARVCILSPPETIEKMSEHSIHLSQARGVGITEGHKTTSTFTAQPPRGAQL